ncbi:aminoglycoside phosphotransferase family protein [Streptomyces scopuliridis]|uniref:Streptomycin 6-kinase n=1 Tax=Streptomyces scopuliridis RB72 TaxID=1440053 RepID=A0A2T7T9S2_9ACTN|nr:aminoglycoside phosphotransferase family protein [Streptomyces scopuliridis]PVE11929.1 hypothetical protein Y717_07760 [Streptomyces scopuliridis RB72]
MSVRGIGIGIPDALAASDSERSDASGRAWIAALPGLVADSLDRWTLRPDGPAGQGMAGLVLPVTRADGTPAALKLQPVSEDNAHAATGLRVWNGDGVVRLFDHVPDTGAMLLERLDATRPLSSMADDTAAMRVLADLPARLVAVPALRADGAVCQTGPRPRTAERVGGHRGRRNRAGTGPGRHRHHPAAPPGEQPVARPTPGPPRRHRPPQ